MLMQQINFPAFVNRRGTKTQFFQRFNHVKRMAARAKKRAKHNEAFGAFIISETRIDANIFCESLNISATTQKKLRAVLACHSLSRLGKYRAKRATKNSLDRLFAVHFLMNLIVVYSDCHRSECSLFRCSSDRLVFAEIDDNTFVGEVIQHD